MCISVIYYLFIDTNRTRHTTNPFRIREIYLEVECVRKGCVNFGGGEAKLISHPFSHAEDQSSNSSVV